jgi:hypothetical protein
MRLSIPSVLFALSLMPLTAQQTLPDRMRAASGDFEILTSRQFPPAELADLVGKADLIGRMLVAGRESRLTADETAIETDYAIQILDIYFTNRPIGGQTIKLTRPDGIFTLDGRSVTNYEPDFPAFEVGHEYVLFLKFNPDLEKYVIPFGSQGAFRNVDGFVDQVSRFNGKLKAERGKVLLSQFEAEVRSLSAHH